MESLDCLCDVTLNVVIQRLPKQESQFDRTMVRGGKIGSIPCVQKKAIAVLRIYVGGESRGMSRGGGFFQ